VYVMNEDEFEHWRGRINRTFAAGDAPGAAVGG